MDRRETLDDVPLLRMMPPELRRRVADAFVPMSAAFGSEIVREGDPADAYYVLASGRARALKRGADGREVPLGILRPGEGFGEAGVLGDVPRAATVRATSDVELLRLDGAALRRLVRDHPEVRVYFQLRMRHRALESFFRLYSPFARLPPEALASLLQKLQSEEVDAGALVVREGEPADAMYVVEEGRLRAFREADGDRRYLASLRRGDFFGEKALFQGRPRAASVETVSPCRLLRLDRDTFRALVEEHPAFRTRIEERVAQYGYRDTARVPLDFAEELLPVDPGTTAAAEEAEAAEEPAADEAPFASPEGRFVKRPGRIRRFPFVRQIDAMDCGAACVAMVCRHFGREVPTSRIRRLVHVSLDGTSLRALCRGAEELGLAARAVKASRSHLLEMPLPAICHWEANHWVVLYDVDENGARIADPASGQRRIPRAELDRKWSGYAALFDYTDAFADAPEGRSGLAWLWPFVRPHVPLLVRALGLALVASGAAMLFPVVTQVIVDRVLVEQDLQLLDVLVSVLLAVVAFMLAAVFVQRYLLSFTAVRIDGATLDSLTRKLLSLPVGYFYTRRTGDLQRRLAGLQEVRQFVVHNAVRGLTAVTQLGAALAVMCVYSRVLTLVFLAVTPLYGGLMQYSRRRLRPLFGEVEHAFGRYQSQQIDAIRGIETVKALGAEDGLRERLLRQFHGVARRVFDADITVMGYEGAVQAVTFLSILLFLAVGSRLVLAGELTVGGLVAFNALVALANAPIGTLLALWDNLQHASVLVDRLDDVFDAEPEQGADRGALRPVRSLEGHVELRDLGFRYGGPDSALVLEGISLDVPAGTTVAIVGRSGSGKTTLAKCLAGLLEATQGTIFYDHVDLRTLFYRDLRRQIGFVLQETHLFDDTIAGNVAFGEEDPDMDRVVWAARVANAHAFVDRLPLGYDTRVGETGMTLSGGQRQRIAIARALYHRPPVLILDEATSSLDVESERAFQENLDRLLEERTCFIVAHRLSTVRNADVIVVLDRGHLVERGTHEELMRRRGLYFYLSSQQLEV